MTNMVENVVECFIGAYKGLVKNTNWSCFDPPYSITPNLYLLIILCVEHTAIRIFDDIELGIPGYFVRKIAQVSNILRSVANTSNNKINLQYCRRFILNWCCLLFKRLPTKLSCL